LFFSSSIFSSTHFILLLFFSTFFPLLSLPLFFFFLMLPPPPTSPLFPYTTLFRSFLLLPSHMQLIMGIGTAEEIALAEVKAQERSEEHTSELQSRFDLVCRLLLEKKKKM